MGMAPAASCCSSHAASVQALIAGLSIGPTSIFAIFPHATSAHAFLARYPRYQPPVASHMPNGTRSSLAIVLARAASFGPSHATTAHALPVCLSIGPLLAVFHMPRRYLRSTPTAVTAPAASRRSPHATTGHTALSRLSIGVRSPPAHHSNRSSSPAAFHTP